MISDQTGAEQMQDNETSSSRRGKGHDHMEEARERRQSRQSWSDDEEQSADEVQCSNHRTRHKSGQSSHGGAEADADVSGRTNTPNFAPQERREKHRHRDTAERECRFTQLRAAPRGPITARGNITINITFNPVPASGGGSSRPGGGAVYSDDDMGGLSGPVRAAADLVSQWVNFQ